MDEDEIDREPVRILFLDQSGKSGGAELCLLDIAKAYRDRALVGLFEDGDFRSRLEANAVPVQVLSNTPIQVRKSSGAIAGVVSLGRLLPLARRVAVLSRSYDLIYANTQKALVVGAIASFLSSRPLVYHLHDILSLEHFSATNRRLAVTLANRAKLVIANSEASRSAFVEAGGRADLVKVVYNGFSLEQYSAQTDTAALRASLGLGEFIVGQFSRLSPWKGQHVLLDALSQCDSSVSAIFVGDALFGEQEYVDQLKNQVDRLGLQHRVRFLGFRSDVIPLMQLCDAIAHTSTAAEPFGRVIVEAMLCGKPTIAAKAGGALELVDHGVTGWLVEPGDSEVLAATIKQCRQHRNAAEKIAIVAQQQAKETFSLEITNDQIDRLLNCLSSI